MDEAPPIRAATLVFETLEALVDLERAGVSALAAELDRPKSTVHDHLQTLTHFEYVLKEDGEYRPSTKLLELGTRTRSRMGIFTTGKPSVDALAAETGEHASLLVEENGLGVLLYTAKAEEGLQVDTHDGMRIHLHTTAPGKAILAFLPRERVDAILDQHGLEAMTPRTVTDRETLFAELDEISEQGYALDRQERIEGMRAVAAPLLGRNRTVLGAVTTFGPASRIDDEQFEVDLPNRLLRTANLIEINYNYR